MHWELWAINNGNLIATFSDETQALSLVRELVSNGWDPADLSLGIEDDTRPVGELPVPLEGSTLALKAGLNVPQRRERRTA